MENQANGMAHLSPVMARQLSHQARNLPKCLCIPTLKAVRWSRC